MIIIKNKQSIEKMRTAGQLLATVLKEAELLIKEGVTTLFIDQFIEKRMCELSLVPECKGYAGYQYATCISLNDVIVHGIPSDEVVLKNGDFVKVDVVGSYKGYCVDMARGFFVGNVDKRVKKIATVTKMALDEAIKQARPGKKVTDISAGIQKIVEQVGFNVVRDFAGHGIGKSIHEEPSIPCFGKPGQGPVLREGMTFAIEPMVTEKSCRVCIMSDGWTAKTCDGGLAAHVEDTIVILRDKAEVLTRLESY